MKFSIEKSTLKNALARMGTMIGASDMLAGILTITTDTFSGVTLRRTSQLGQMKLDIGGIAEDDGTSSVSFDRMAAVIAGIQTERIEFTQSKGRLMLKAGKAKPELGEYNPEETPEEMKEDTSAPTIQVPAKMLCAAILTVSSAMSKDKARAAFMGVNFRVMNDKLVLCATNGNLLSYFEICDCDSPLKPSEDESFDEGYFVPSDAVSPIQKLLEGKDVNVDLVFTERKIIFSGSGFEIQVPLGEKGLPNFAKATEGLKITSTVKFKKGEVMRVASSAASVISEDYNPCVIEAEKGVVRLFAQGGNSASWDEEIEASPSHDFKIKMNALGLRDMIAVQSGEDIEIEIAERAIVAKSPGVFTQLALLRVE